MEAFGGSFIFLSFLVIVLLQAPLCFSGSIKGVNNGATFKIVKAKSQDQLSEQVLLQDQMRVDSLHSILSETSGNAQILNQKTTKLPAKQGVQLSIGTGNYVVQVGFGTPAKSMSLIFDTASDLTWIQCEPCAKYCYKQNGPKFDRTKSTSYSKITCNTTQCAQLKSTTGVTSSCGLSSTCNYRIKYSKSSYSMGHFGHDTLTLSPSDVFKNFQFGCGLNNRGPYGSAAGSLGLSHSKLSFVSQTMKKYGGVFSYCLPQVKTGYLTFGIDKQKGAYDKVKFTPLTINPRSPSLYSLNLKAIIVNGRLLSIPSSTFASGMIIDSGTSITRLPPVAYTALRTAFQDHMSSHKKAKPLSILDTCYDVTGDDLLSIPQVSLVFEGNVDVYMDCRITAGTSSKQFCLAFAANKHANDVAILGNMQQRGLKIVYDIPKKRLGFGPADCSLAGT